MTILPGVTLVALAILFTLTTLALGIAGRVAHPYRVVTTLAALLVLGMALLVAGE
jgi:hypothetical protein